MRVKQVAKMEAVDRFLYWIKERHQIHLRRKAGKTKPWTDDVVLQSYFFTNPYRENDKTTVWFRETVREPLRDNMKVLMATIIFRWFNRIPTGQMLAKSKLLTNWREITAVDKLRDLTPPVFTGAYMIKAGNGPPGCKIPNVCEAISTIWEKRKQLVQVCLQKNTLQALVEQLKTFPHIGGFMAYEVACDLRYTYLLENATDVDTWCNVGPGASRGLCRLNDIPIKVPRTGMKDARPKLPEDWQVQIQQLAKRARRQLRKMPKFEMREMEHSLCEWDKYERMRLNQGKSKRKYDGH